MKDSRSIGRGGEARPEQCNGKTKRQRRATDNFGVEHPAGRCGMRGGGGVFDVERIIRSDYGEIDPLNPERCGVTMT